MKPTIPAHQIWSGMKATDEQQAAYYVQYNQLVTQFVSGHASLQGSIGHLTETNSTQQQHITTLQHNFTNSVAQITYVPPVQQHMMQMMPMQQQQQHGHGQGERDGGRRSGHGGRHNQNKNTWQGMWGQMQQQTNTMQQNVNFGTIGTGTNAQTQNPASYLF